MFMYNFPEAFSSQLLLVSSQLKVKPFDFCHMQLRLGLAKSAMKVLLGYDYRQKAVICQTK